MPPKQLHRTSPAPPACPTFPPYSALLQPPVFGWLFCVVCAVVDWQSSKVTMYYIYISFLSFHSPPQSMGQYLPTRSPPTRLHYNTPLTATHNNQHELPPPFPPAALPSIDMATSAMAPDLGTTTPHGSVSGAGCPVRSCCCQFCQLKCQNRTNKKIERWAGLWP